MLQKKSKKILDELKYLLKLSRPRFWFYLAGPALLGVVYASTTPSNLFDLSNALFLLYFLIPANIMLYGINDYFDREVDKRNPKKNDKEAMYSSSRLVDFLIVLSALSAVPLLMVLPQRTYLILAVFLLLSIQYSAPPLRFKTKPFLDSVSNGLYVLPFFIGYFYVSGKYPPTSVFLGAWTWTMGMHTFSAIPDIKPDRESGIQTTATFIGRKSSFMYVGLVWSITCILMALNSLGLGLLFSVYPLSLILIYVSEVDDSRAYWWFPIFNLFVGMLITMNGLWRIFHV